MLLLASLIQLVVVADTSASLVEEQPCSSD